jgi:hypothetical protein
MRPLKSLTFEAFLDTLSQTFAGIEDSRQPQRINFSLHDALMTAFAMFFFQHPSLLQFQIAMKQRRGRCNLESIFGVRQLPSQTQLRDIIDAADSASIRRLLPIFFEQMRRAGWAYDYQSAVSRAAQTPAFYVAALDGTDYFHSQALNCPACLQRRDKTGQMHFYHTVVAATLVKANSHKIWPLDAEAVANEDGNEKQDCEINAAKRLLPRLRQEHPHLPLLLTADDLYSRAPFVALCQEYGFSYVLVAKPDSHKEMMEWVEEIEQLGGGQRGQWVEGPACKRRSFEYRITKQVPLNSERRIDVNYFEVWEKNKVGKVVYHNSFITDVEVSAENVADLVGIGRAKWKIENEQFNVQKNQGYELEHNYGHGKHNLSHNFYLINLLSFVAHKVLERGSQRYERIRQRGVSRRELWNGLRLLMQRFLLRNWEAMLEMYEGEEGDEEGSP